jgi:tRNA A37 methylthiotransferase MiaB
MRPKIGPEIIKERSERLRALGVRKKEAFRGRLTGSSQLALVLEERADDGRLVGLTGNYMEVLVPDDETLCNRFVQARLDQPLPGGRWEVSILDREN